jgi:hypothetical protein
MPERSSHPRVAAIVVALAVAGCQGNTSPPRPAPEPVLFYEPVSFCFADGDTARTLALYNLGDDPLTWTPTHVPAASSGLAGPVVVPPHDGATLDWTWAPVGGYPVLDSLVATTDDPAHRTVSLRLRREDPSGFTDTVPPDAPLLAYPADGASFVLDSGTRTADIVLVWSELDDCSGIQGYRLEIATDRAFGQVVFTGALGTPPDTLVAEAGDVGTAYWRITARDGAGLWGPPSAVRSWTVQAP